MSIIHAISVMSRTGGIVVPVVALQGPVSPATDTTLAPCWSNYQINVDEEEYEGGPSNNFISQRSGGPWITVGVPADVWVERVFLAGNMTPGHDPGAGRLQMNVTREYGVNQVGIGIKSCVCRFDVWDAPSGGNMIDQNTVSFQATVNSP